MEQVLQKDDNSVEATPREYSQKSSTISLAKLTATVLVVLVHAWNITTYAGASGAWLGVLNPFRALANTAVPLFIAISSFLLFRKPFRWKENVKKKSRTLLLPFFIWSLFWVGFECVAGLILPTMFSDVRMWTLRDWFIGICGIPFLPEPFCPIYSPLWFLRDLFLMNLIAPVIGYLTKKAPRISAVLAIAFWFVQPLSIHLRQQFTFFTLGAAVAQQRDTVFHFVANHERPCQFTTAGLSVALSVALVFCKGVAYQIVSGVTVLVFAFGILLLCNRITKSKGNAIGDKVNRLLPISFIVYVTHGKLLSACQILCTKTIPQIPPIVILEYFLLPTVVVVLCGGLGMLFRILLPKVFGVVTGGRI